MEDETLTGVMDDRGKFIYITQDEYNAVAKFIRQRGRVSLRALAESSNQLINLNPDLKPDSKPDSKTVEGEITEQTEQWPRKRLIGGNQNVEWSTDQSQTSYNKLRERPTRRWIIYIQRTNWAMAEKATDRRQPECRVRESTQTTRKLKRYT